MDAESALHRATALADPEPTAPVVLVGSGTGALLALQTAAAADPELPIEGIVLADIAPTGPVWPEHVDPADGADPYGDWEAELTARTACPTHRSRITHDDAFVRGQLNTDVPSHLLVTALPGHPALILHGEADPVTPIEHARTLADQLPRATLGVLHEGASTSDAVRQADRFAVHVLGTENTALAEQFARSGIDRFGGCAVERGRRRAATSPWCACLVDRPAHAPPATRRSPAGGGRGRDRRRTRQRFPSRAP